MLIAFFAVPTHALAQECGGSVGISSDGVDITGNTIPDYFYADLPATVNWTLTPKSGTPNEIVVDQVQFALSCANNGDLIPCANGNDGQAGDNSLTPLQYVALTGGTCGATFNNVTDGVVTFDLPDASLDQTGCSITLETQLWDIGTDANPARVTPAVFFTGTCLGGELDGTARGSAIVQIIDPEIEVTKTGPETAKVGDEFDYEISFTATADGVVLGECTGNDPLLGGDLGVFLPDTPRTFPYTPQAGDPDPLLNTVTITCDVNGSASTVVDDDGHSVDLIDPAITVTKTGPEVVKVGDTATYTIGFDNTGTGALENCTGSDTLLGDLGAFVDGVDRTFDRVVQADDPDPLPNTATITCDVVGFDNQASDSDEHSVDLINPAITVTKTGPEVAKVGDTVTYTIGFDDIGTGALENCTGSDTLLGDLGAFVDGVDRTFDRVVQADDPDPLPNTATITCDVVGFDNQASDSDEHSVDLINPAITVTKTGPEVAKVGDTITYTIGFDNSGTGALENCLGSDTLLGDLGAFEDGVDRTFDRTVEAGDPDPLPNTATITCDVVGFDNQASDSDEHSVDLINPAITVTKTGPEVAKVGDTITYTIGFDSTGTGALENCLGSDTLLGDLGAFEDGVDRTFDRTVEAGDPDPLPNTATIACDVVGFDNQASDSDEHSVDLIDPAITVTKTGPEVAKVGDTITYTIGFDSTGTGTLENCTGSDTLLGDLGAFEDGVDRTFDRTVEAGDPDPLPNTATIACDVVGFDNQASDSADHSVDLIDPAITVTKTGPDEAKVGDTITYTIGFDNTGTGDVENCLGSDTLLGDLGAFEDGVDRTFDRVVEAGDPNPLPNTATITCDVVGFDNQASDSADHSVDLIDPAITVTKTGPDEAKVGDTVTYTIGFDSTGTGALENCLGSDTLLGDLGAFEDGVDRTFDRTVEAGDPDPLPNTATITCDVVGFDNQASDSDDHSVDLFEVAADLVKECRPDPVMAGEEITWEITINNTGDKDIDCLVDDAIAGLTGEPLSVAAGDSDSVTASRVVEASDAPVLSNTATASCSVAGYDNTLDLGPADADCEVIVVAEICRTPGFWGSHAGTEKSRSTDLTQWVIDAAGGSLSICGQTIDNTDEGNVMSAVEAMCVSPQGSQQRQLARQLTAAALNCVISDGGADCSGTSIETLFAEANAACEANAGNLSGYIEAIDAFNNDEECHERDLSESDVFDGVSPLPGPAGSPRACNGANKNDIYVVPANP